MRFAIAFLTVLAVATATGQHQLLAHNSKDKVDPERSVDGSARKFPDGHPADLHTKRPAAMDEVTNQFKEDDLPSHPKSWTPESSGMHDHLEVNDEQVVELITIDAETDLDEAAVAPEVDYHEHDHTKPHDDEHGGGKGKHHHEEHEEDHEPHEHDGELEDRKHGSKHPKHHGGGLRGHMRRMADKVMAAIGFKHPHGRPHPHHHAGRKMQHRPAGPPSDDALPTIDDDGAPIHDDHHDDREHGRDRKKHDHHDEHDRDHQDEHDRDHHDEHDRDHDDEHDRDHDEHDRDHDDHGGLRGKPRHGDRHHHDDDDDDDWHHHHRHHDHDDDGIGGLIALILIVAGVVFLVRRIRRRRRMYAALVATVQRLEAEVAHLRSGQSGPSQAPGFNVAPQMPLQSQPQPQAQAQAQAQAHPPMYPHAQTHAGYMNNVSGDRDDAPLLQMRGQSTY